MILLGELARSLHTGLRISSVDFSSAKQLVAICSSKICAILDANTFLVAFQLGRLSGSVHRGDLMACRFDPKGAVIATAGEDKKIVIWDLTTGQTIRALQKHQDVITALEFSADGSLLFTASADCKVIVWSWMQGTILHTLGGRAGSASSISLCEKTNRLAVGSMDGSFEIWDSCTFRRLAAIPPHQLSPQDASPSDLSFGHDAPQLHTGAVNCVALSPEGRYLASCSNDFTCKIWSIVSFSRDFALDHTPEPKSALISIAYATLVGDATHADASWGAMPPDDHPAIHPQAHLVSDLLLDAPCFAAVFSVDETLLFTGSYDATVRAWRPESGELVFQINLPISTSGVAFDDASRTLYVPCDSRLLAICFTTQEKGHIRVTTESKAAPSVTKQPSSTVSAAESPRRRGHHEQRATTSLPPQVLLARVQSAPPDLGRHPVQKQAMARSDVIRHIAHGSVAATHLFSILVYSSGVNHQTLLHNLQHAGLSVPQVIRAMAREPFPGADVLRFLSASTSDAAPFLNCIALGVPMSNLLKSRGLVPDPPRDLDSREPAFISLSAPEMDDLFCYRIHRPLPSRRSSTSSSDEYPQHDLDHLVHDLHASAAGQSDHHKRVQFLPAQLNRILRDGVEEGWEGMPPSVLDKIVPALPYHRVLQHFIDHATPSLQRGRQQALADAYNLQHRRPAPSSPSGALASTMTSPRPAALSPPRITSPLKGRASCTLLEVGGASRRQEQSLHRTADTTHFINLTPAAPAISPPRAAGTSESPPRGRPPAPGEAHHAHHQDRDQHPPRPPDTHRSPRRAGSRDLDVAGGVSNINNLNNGRVDAAAVEKDGWAAAEGARSAFERYVRGLRGGVEGEASGMPRRLHSGRTFAASPSLQPSSSHHTSTPHPINAPLHIPTGTTPGPSSATTPLPVRAEPSPTEPLPLWLSRPQRPRHAESDPPPNFMPFWSGPAAKREVTIINGLQIGFAPSANITGTTPPTRTNLPLSSPPHQPGVALPHPSAHRPALQPLLTFAPPSVTTTTTTAGGEPDRINRTPRAATSASIAASPLAVSSASSTRRTMAAGGEGRASRTRRSGHGSHELDAVAQPIVIRITTFNPQLEDKELFATGPAAHVASTLLDTSDTA